MIQRRFRGFHCLQLGDDLVGRRFGACVHQEDALVADLDRDIAARAADQPDVALDRNDDQLVAEPPEVRNHTGLDVLRLDARLPGVLGRMEIRLRNLRSARATPELCGCCARVPANERDRHEAQERRRPRRFFPNRHETPL